MIDIIIFSPPFSNQIHKIPKSFAEGHPDRPASNFGVYVETDYGDENNIGNLKYD